MEKYYITAPGFERMEAELKNLKNKERPEIIADIATAREHGDLKENAEYKAAKEKQSFVEGKILELEDKKSRSEIIDISKLSGDKVTFGATVTVEEIETEKKKTYTIVSEYEADLNKSKIANTSPIAKGLIGKSVGDDIEITTPKGIVDYELLKIEFLTA